jgi:hypothetical protein
LAWHDVQVLSVLIVINAVVSFRSVPRIFRQLTTFCPGLVAKIPHHNSVINWTLQFGIALLTNIQKQAPAWFAVIDMSIETGLGKALVVLRVPISTWVAKNDEALCLADCECIGVEVRDCWTATAVRTSLETIFLKAGQPAFVIKDKGQDLAKGCSLLNLPSVDDIGHEAANALKKCFAKEKWFTAFLLAVATVGSKLRQTNLSFLVPPRIRSKGRFQSIERVAQWAVRVMDYYDGLKPISSRSKKLAGALATLLTLKKPIQRLLFLCQKTNSILTVLKKQGLNENSSQVVSEQLRGLPGNCRVRQRFEAWLAKHLTLLATLRQLHPTLTSLPVSSDVIESLFGRFKHVIARQPRPELNHIVAIIATLCGNPSPAVIAKALASTSIEDLKAWQQKACPETIERKRRNFRYKTDEAVGRKRTKTGKAA